MLWDCGCALEVRAEAGSWVLLWVYLEKKNRLMGGLWS